MTTVPLSPEVLVEGGRPAIGIEPIHQREPRAAVDEQQLRHRRRVR